MSVAKLQKQSSASLSLNPSVESNRTEKKSRVGKTIEWVRKCEVGSTAEKAGVFVLKYLTIFVLFASLIGIPFFFDLYDEYLSQSFEEKHASLVDRLKKANIEIQTKAEADITQLQSENNSLKGQLAIAKETAKITKREFGTLQDYLSELRVQQRDLEALNDSLLKENDSLRGKVAAQQKQLHDSSGHILELTGLVNVYQMQKANLQARLDSAQQAIQKFEKLVFSLQQQKAQLEQQLKNVQSEALHEQEGLRRLIHVAVQRIHELENQIQNIQEQSQQDQDAIAYLQSNLLETTTKLSTKEADLRRATAFIQSREKEMERLKAELGDAHKNAALDKNLSLVQSQGFADFLIKINEVQTYALKLEQEIASLKDFGRKTAQELVQREMARLDEQMKALQETLQRKEEEIAALSVTLQKTAVTLKPSKNVPAQASLLQSSNSKLPLSSPISPAKMPKSSPAYPSRDLLHSVSEKAPQSRSSIPVSSSYVRSLEKTLQERELELRTKEQLLDNTIHQLQEAQKSNSRLRSNFEKSLEQSKQMDEQLRTSLSSESERHLSEKLALNDENLRLIDALNWACSHPRDFEAVIEDRGIDTLVETVQRGTFDYPKARPSGPSRSSYPSLTSPKEAQTPRRALAAAETQLKAIHAENRSLQADLERAESSFKTRFSEETTRIQESLEKEYQERLEAETRRIRQEAEREYAGKTGQNKAPADSKSSTKSES